MLKRVATRLTVQPLQPYSFPKSHLLKHYETVDEKQEEIKYKRLSRMSSSSSDHKLRRLRRSPDESISRNLSYTLRHGAKKQGIDMRPDGFVKVTDILALENFHAIDFAVLERIVKEDVKHRYTLNCEPGGSRTDGVWWIRANQGHSLSGIVIQTTRITDASQVPMAVHGTSKVAWERIAIEGLSRMKRHHIHFAQGLAGPQVISGMRSSSQIFIYVDLPLALESGLEFLLSSNGVVLCPGDERGVIGPRFFSRVEWAGNRQPLKGWEGRRRSTTPPVSDSVSENLDDEDADATTSTVTSQ